MALFWTPQWIWVNKTRLFLKYWQKCLQGSLRLGAKPAWSDPPFYSGRYPTWQAKQTVKQMYWYLLRTTGQQQANATFGFLQRDQVKHTNSLVSMNPPHLQAPRGCNTKLWIRFIQQLIEIATGNNSVTSLVFITVTFYWKKRFKCAAYNGTYKALYTYKELSYRLMR